MFLPDTNRKLEKSMEGVKYYWISENDFMNLLKDSEKCIALLANQSVLTIRFESNDSCIKDDTLLSLSNKLSTDIEAYQYLDYGQYLWMGYGL